MEAGDVLGHHCLIHGSRIAVSYEDPTYNSTVLNDGSMIPHETLSPVIVINLEDSGLPIGYETNINPIPGRRKLPAIVAIVEQIGK